MKILDILDQKINGYYQLNKEYPNKIIMSQETKNKIFIELEEIDINLSWKDKKDNYRGIKIEIKKDIFLELK